MTTKGFCILQPANLPGGPAEPQLLLATFAPTSAEAIEKAEAVYRTSGIVSLSPWGELQRMGYRVVPHTLESAG